MPLEARKYLFDIQQAVNLIEGFCAGRSFTQLRVEVENLLAADPD